MGYIHFYYKTIQKTKYYYAYFYKVEVNFHQIQKQIFKFMGLILLSIVKFDENFNFLKEPQNVGTNCEKGVKIRYSYYIKMRVKSRCEGNYLIKR